jgi:hypothetical protein
LLGDTPDAWYTAAPATTVVLAMASAVIGLFVLSAVVAVVIIADLIMAGLQFGCAARSRAATPLACGQAIDVPDATRKSLANCVWSIISVGIVGVTDARMLSPGAKMSGLSTPATAPERSNK